MEKDENRRSHATQTPRWQGQPVAPGLALLVGLVALVASCKGGGGSDDDAATPPRGSVVVLNGDAGKRTTSIPVALEDAYGGFSLYQSATAFTVQMDSCLSGLTATVTEANLDGLEVYENDRGCLAKLTQFTLNGRTYYPTAGEPFDTWQPGDVARFDEVGEPGTYALDVVVLSTLGDPVISTDVIKLGLAEIAEGAARHVLWSTVGLSGSYKNATFEPPSFTVRSIEFMGHDLGTEAGKFKFVLECTASLGITNVCNGVDLADVDYKLVKDTYSDAPTQGQCDTLFASTGTPVTLPGERVAPGASSTTNGGFVTVTLTGPGDLLTNANAMLVLRSAGDSYQYFNIDTTLSADYAETAGPTIARVRTAHANGTFGIGAVIDVDVTFNEPVILTGTASTLTMDTGATAVFHSQPAAATLRFRYTVQAGEGSLDLDVDAYDLNGDTIEDDLGNAGSVLLPGGAESLAGSSAIVIDTVPPLINSISSSHANGSFSAGEVIDIDVTFTAAITLTGTASTLTVNSGGTATYLSQPSGSSLRYRYTVGAGEDSADLDVTAISLNGDTITDGANAADLTLPSGVDSLAGSKAIVVDTTAPTITGVTSSTLDGAYTTGQAISIQVTYTEIVTLAGTGPGITLRLETGTTDRTASYASGSGTTTLTFTYTVQAGDTTSDLDAHATAPQLTLTGTAPTLRDAAGNNASLAVAGTSLATNKDLVIDTTAPTITNTTSATLDGSYNAGDVIAIDVTYSEPVTLAGTSPGITLRLETGATDRTAIYAAGSGTATLSFNYTVQSGDTSADLNTHATAPQLTLTGTSPTLRDAAGNNASRTIAGTTLATNKSLVIDTTIPPALSAFSGATCCTVNPLKANAIEVTITYPATVTDYSSLSIRRVTGATAPADCTSGTLVTTINGPFTGGTTTRYTDDTGVAGAAHSYRACITDTVGNLRSSNTFTNRVSSKIAWIFATSTDTHTGDLGGLAAADSICQTAGAAIDNTLNWVAVLSSTAMNASGRVPVRGSVYNRASTPAAVATNRATMWGGAWATAVTYDESGSAVTGNAWTGSTSTGALDRSNYADSVSNHCDNWTSASGAVNGRHGDVTGVTSTWAESGTQSCSGTGRIYCMSKTIEPLAAFSAATGTTTDGNIEVTVTFPASTTGYSKVDIRRKLGSTAPSTACTDTLVKSYTGTYTSETFVDPTATTAGAYYSYIACLYDSTGIVATSLTPPARAYSATTSHALFTTSATYTGNLGGLTGGDAICKTLGDRLDNTRTWQFIGSSSTTDAASRLTLTGNIRLVNGTLVATSEADFFDGTLTAAISLSENGVSQSGRPWTGSTNAGVKYGAGTYCTDWTDGTGSASGRRGRASTTTTHFSSQTSVCSTASNLYCISSAPY